ncbi:MAG: hypothetical protein IT262_06130 [Saprospiraceae bacterium]|nr:hypothetical protein [Saprospiraceae bacterium]
MNLHPRQHTPHVRSTFGRSLQMLRHSLESSSGFSPDGLLSPARDFNNKVPKYKPAHRSLNYWLRWLAWLTGVIVAIVYLLWFFKHIFEHTIR